MYTGTDECVYSTKAIKGVFAECGITIEADLSVNDTMTDVDTMLRWVTKIQSSARSRFTHAAMSSNNCHLSGILYSASSRDTRQMNKQVPCDWL